MQTIGRLGQMPSFLLAWQKAHGQNHVSERSASTASFLVTPGYILTSSIPHMVLGSLPRDLFIRTYTNRITFYFI